MYTIEQRLEGAELDAHIHHSSSRTMLLQSAVRQVVGRGRRSVKAGWLACSTTGVQCLLMGVICGGEWDEVGGGG